MQNKKIRYGGMEGGLQIFAELLNPTREECIADARAMLKAHRKCVIANAVHGRQYKGTFWLNRAAHYRNLAKLTKLAKEITL